MPSVAHEGLVELVRDHPDLVAEMLGLLFDLSVPTYADVRLEPEDLSQWQATECRADAVVTLRSSNGEVLLAVVVEVQRSCDPDKRYVWLLYVAALQARLRCDALLVVIAPDRRIARWCEAPTWFTHPGLMLAPLVAGPEAIPVITDGDQARAQPWLAVLAAIAHHRSQQRDAVFAALLEGLRSVDGQRAILYSDIVLAWLPSVARKYLEGLMATGKYEYQSEFVRRFYDQGRSVGRDEGEAKGEVKGEAKAILTVLAARGLKVSAAVRERIINCADATQLTAWLQRAVTVRRAEDLFA